MSKSIIDHDHHKFESRRLLRYRLLDLMNAGDGRHPKIRMLERRRKGSSDATRVKQFLRIERGRIA